MNKKTWGIFGLVCVVLFGALIYMSLKNRVDVSHVDQNKIQPANKLDGNIADHVGGKKDSPVILIEYGDYQCPYCGQAFPKVKKVTDKYQGQIAYVFRNLPLTTMHPNALAAAGAAEAAGMQGKFWQMHDLLYENQNSWNQLTGNQLTSQLVEFAKQLKLDDAKFKTDLASSNVQQKISFDRALYAKISNEPSTPSFILDGKQVPEDVAQSAISGDGSKFDAAIASALKSHHIALPQ